MTLVASPPLPIENSETNKEYDSDDNDSQSSNDVMSKALKKFENFNTRNQLVQNLGHPEGEVLPSFGNVFVENSSDVHFGDTNIYQGPVTIKQIVYANGSSLVNNNDTVVKPINSNEIVGNDNLGFEGDRDNNRKNSVCASETKARDSYKTCDIGVVRNNDVNESNGGGRQNSSGSHKGFICFKDVAKRRRIELILLVAVVLIFLLVLMLILLLKQPALTNEGQLKNKLRIVSRSEWVAQPPLNKTDPLVTPVPYVIIHHTATENCSSQGQCVFHVRYIQTFHIESKGFYDIGYNFLVGGDGAAYEGRGWTVEGAHLLGYNSRSIGIAFIGTFINFRPPDIQILAAKRLIEIGVQKGYIQKDYKLFGARQLHGTESPGAKLFDEIQTWDHWAKEP